MKPNFYVGDSVLVLSRTRSNASSCLINCIGTVCGIRNTVYSPNVAVTFDEQTWGIYWGCGHHCESFLKDNSGQWFYEEELMVVGNAENDAAEISVASIL